MERPLEHLLAMEAYCASFEGENLFTFVVVEITVFTFLLPSSPLLNKARRVCSAWPSANRSQTAIYSWHCAEGEIGRRRREEQSEARRTENEDEQRMKTNRE